MSEIRGVRLRGRAFGRPESASEPNQVFLSNGNGVHYNNNGNSVRGEYRGVANGCPSVGDSGQSVSLVANYFKLETSKDITIYDYQIDFEPHIESKFMRKALFYSHREAFGSALLFDGNSNVKSTKLLDKKETEFFSERRNDGQQIRIRVRLVGEISWGHLEMMRMYNIQMRRNLKHLEWRLIGGHYFDPKETKTLSEHKLEVLKGMSAAVNSYEEGILLCCDTLHKVIRLDTCYDVLKRIFRDSDRENKEDFREKARKELSGSIVWTTYNDRTYRIDDIDFDKNANHEFELRDGMNTNLINYYKKQYEITIKDERQPLLVGLPNVRQRRGGQTTPIFLIPELCRMTGLSESLRKDFKVRKSMTQSTQTDPLTRVKYLQQFIESISQNSKIRDEMNVWKLDFQPKPIEIKGRRLDCERILMRGDTPQTGTTFNQRFGDFTKEIRNKSMFKTVNINEWLIICTKYVEQTVKDFAQTLNRVCKPLGIHFVKRPNFITIDNDKISTYAEVCKGVTLNTELVVVVLTNNNSERYEALKKIFCLDRPIPSQMIVFKTISDPKKLMSVSTKLGIQMACKVGAEVWALHIPPKDLMVVGYDIHRDSSGRRGTAGGFVCSTNETLTKWYSRVSYHEKKEEMSGNLATNISLGLKHYYETNKKLPQRLLIYRDGVSEGDIEWIYNSEVNKIKETIKNISDSINSDSIKIAFVLVNKRINTRILEKTHINQYSNPIPGTVVDKQITRTHRKEFYLISQCVRQGTVVPTLYSVVKDETNWKPYHHQQIAYKLTHLYYNWMGTIRVPAPTKYAHKLAHLTATALHSEPNGSLSDKLFFI